MYKYKKIVKNQQVSLLKYSKFLNIRNFDYLFMKGGNPRLLENILVLEIDPSSPLTRKAIFNSKQNVK